MVSEALLRRAQARAVLLNALSGRLSLEALHDSWPVQGDSLLDAIFEETEETIEHVPGSLRRRGVDEDRFRESVARKILVIDAQILGDEFADVPSERMTEIRERLLKELNLGLDDEAIATAVREFMAREIAGNPN